MTHFKNSLPYNFFCIFFCIFFLSSMLCDYFSIIGLDHQTSLPIRPRRDSEIDLAPISHLVFVSSVPGSSSVSDPHSLSNGNREWRTGLEDGIDTGLGNGRERGYSSGGRNGGEENGPLPSVIGTTVGGLDASLNVGSFIASPVYVGFVRDRLAAPLTGLIMLVNNEPAPPGFVKLDEKAANTDTITPVNIVTPCVLYKKSIG